MVFRICISLTWRPPISQVNQSPCLEIYVTTLTNRCKNFDKSYTVSRVNQSPWLAEIDISVSKLLGFETFANFLRVSVSVSENLVSEKKSRYRFRKIWYRKKSTRYLFRKFGIGKKSRYPFRKFGIRKKSRYRFRSNFWYRHSVGQGGIYGSHGTIRLV